MSNFRVLTVHIYRLTIYMAQSPCSFLPLVDFPCSLFYSPFTYLETLLGVIGSCPLWSQVADKLSPQ
jgi:hypothetical protein